MAEEITKEQMIEECRRAARIVAAWPLWKQNLLKNSLKPTRSQPRDQVLEDE